MWAVQALQSLTIQSSKPTNLELVVFSLDSLDLLGSFLQLLSQPLGLPHGPHCLGGLESSPHHCLVPQLGIGLEDEGKELVPVQSGADWGSHLEEEGRTECVSAEDVAAR